MTFYKTTPERHKCYLQHLSDTLDKVKDILVKRGANYAPAEENLGVTAELWNAFNQAEGYHFDHFDVAMGMVMMKLGRISTGQYNPDNFDDAIGYLAIAKYLGLLRIEKEVKISGAATLRPADNPHFIGGSSYPFPSKNVGCGGACTDCMCNKTTKGQ